MHFMVNDDFSFSTRLTCFSRIYWIYVCAPRRRFRFFVPCMLSVPPMKSA